MRYYVYYCYDYDDGRGFESFDDDKEVVAFISNIAKSHKLSAEEIASSFTVIRGKELRVDPVQVVTDVQIIG